MTENISLFQVVKTAARCYVIGPVTGSVLLSVGIDQPLAPDLINPLLTLSIQLTRCQGIRGQSGALNSVQTRQKPLLAVQTLLRKLRGVFSLWVLSSYVSFAILV